MDILSFVRDSRFNVRKRGHNVINYDEIDEKCIPMVRFFNDIGLKTKFSCQGHDDLANNSFYVMFDESIGSSDIMDFLLRFENNYTHSPFAGRFFKWMRKMNGAIVSNWEYRVSYGQSLTNQVMAKLDLDIMVDQYKK